MPYIKQEEREFNACDSCGHFCAPIASGQLNFAISLYLNEYVERKGLSYQTINDILGALEGAKLEFYRRVAAPYENLKMVQNGDVYQR